MSDKKDKAGEEKPVVFRVVDKRPFADPDKIPLDNHAAQEKPRYPSFVEELMSKLKKTEDAFEEKKAQMQAELHRIRTRLENDYERRVELEKQKQLLPLLEVLDNLERALAVASESQNFSTLLEGVEMIAALFRSKLQSLGIQAIPLLNEPFDPNFSQAVGMVAVIDPGLDGHVVEELLRGYSIGDQVLRPAQVRVGYVAEEPEPATTEPHGRS